jgi:hypothetical protein
VPYLWTSPSAGGWSILARTGLRTGQATEVILYAERWQPLVRGHPTHGVFSAWQQLNGAVSLPERVCSSCSPGRSPERVSPDQLVIDSTDAAATAMVRAARG